MNKIIYTKISTLLLALFLILNMFIILSCSGTQSVDVLPEETNTTKYAATILAETCEWLDDSDSIYLNAAAEADETSEKIIDSAYQAVFKKYSNKDESNAKEIYPSIVGFGSLDTSDISDRLYAKIETFISYINSGNFSKLEVAKQKKYLRVLAQYRLQTCKPVTESHIGKVEDVTIEIDTQTTKILKKIPILIDSSDKKHVVVLYYDQKEDKNWQINRFEVYDE